MSSVAKNYAFVVRTKSGHTKEVPIMSKERIEQAKKNVAPLMEKKNGTRKN